MCCDYIMKGSVRVLLKMMGCPSDYLLWGVLGGLVVLLVVVDAIWWSCRVRLGMQCCQRLSSRALRVLCCRLIELEESFTI